MPTRQDIEQAFATALGGTRSEDGDGAVRVHSIAGRRALQIPHEGAGLADQFAFVAQVSSVLGDRRSVHTDLVWLGPKDGAEVRFRVSGDEWTDEHRVCDDVTHAAMLAAIEWKQLRAGDAP